MSREGSDGSLEGETRLAFFRTLAGGVSGYVSCVDRQRRMLYLNRSVSRDMSQILGKPMETFVAEEHRQIIIDGVDAAFASGEQQTLTYAAVLRDGSRHTLETRIVPFTGSGGEPLALMLTENATDQRRLVAELERSELFRRQVVENLPDYVTLLDREHRFVWVNRYPAGLEPQDVLGKRVDEFRSPAASAVGRQTIQAAFEQGVVGEYETEGFRTRDAMGWYLSRAVPIVTNGRIDNVLLITSDITERKLAEQALRQTQEQLHQAQRLEGLGQLAGGIAHDFNNLLQIISGNLSFAQSRLKRGEDPTEELEHALRGTERAGELTAHLLAIGRRTRVTPERVDLGSLVDNSIRMLRRAIPENVGLLYEAPTEPCFVELDVPQFDQVLINLCVNARDAMPQGGTLTVRVAPEGAAHVVVSVSDTGSGIAPENLQRIFEPFFTTKRGGSGLGLAVATGIVAAHGGELFADSDGETGTTFSVHLPRVETARSTPVEEAGAINGGSGSILVAEDEDLVRAHAVRILREAGYAVLEATTGAEAVRVFEEHQSTIDLVLMDAIMPELDGWQAFLKIVELKPDATVLFTTGYSADVLPEDLESRNARLLSKPYRASQLLTHVRELIGLGESSCA